jgi:hypothetical protein
MQTYPDRPMLIPHEGVAALTKALDAWWWPTAAGPWMRCFCADYRDLCFERDKDYVTTSREKMLGMKLEEMQAGREDRLPQISAAIEPLRMALREHSGWAAASRTMPITGSSARSCSSPRSARCRRWPRTIPCATGSSGAATCSAGLAAIPG